MKKITVTEIVYSDNDPSRNVIILKDEEGNRYVLDNVNGFTLFKSVDQISSIELTLLASTVLIHGNQV